VYSKDKEDTETRHVSSARDKNSKTDSKIINTNRPESNLIKTIHRELVARCGFGRLADSVCGLLCAVAAKLVVH